MSLSVKTMRDIWDSERKKKEVRKCPPFTYNKVFPPDIGKYYFDYLAMKKAFFGAKDEIIKAFADYEKHLGKAGFS